MPFPIREANASDVPALARLHVTTFNQTHSPILRDGPTYELRERQWREAFRVTDGSWFCYVAEIPDGGLAGFAKGVRHAGAGPPGFGGELNKIYVLREHHRRGVGRRLLCHAARRFLDEGIDSMLLFGDARSPSNGFYERLGAEKLFAPGGEFHGGYGWRDLRRLAESCPAG